MLGKLVQCLRLFVRTLSSPTAPNKLFAVGFCGVCVFASGCDHQGQGPRDANYSWSVAQARKRGSLVYEIEVSPKSVPVGERVLSFGEAWLERCDNKAYNTAYALCIRIDKPADTFDDVFAPHLVLDDRDASFKMHLGRGWIQYVEFLASSDLTGVRASYIKTRKDERPKNIQFKKKEAMPGEKGQAQTR
jgi:hypothetical protein